MLAVTAAVLTADGGAQHRVSNPHFGVSGGNVTNRSNAFCCSGTLGALVEDTSGVQYILSNNHVLANSNNGRPGDDISQPGMIDTGCSVTPTMIVGDLTTFASLNSNVDAAIAALRAGKMDSTGHIEDIGVPSRTVAAPFVGQAVAKSGRTTGFTTGTVRSVNTDVNVQYQEGCNKGRKFVVSFNDQVVIGGSSFSAGGDSGSLIVTNNSSHNPVGLLFAGSSTTTIANPIGEVLSKLGTALGKGLRVTGSGTAPFSEFSALSTDEIARGTRAKEAHARRLMANPAIFGVGVGEDPNSPGQAAVVIYAQRGLARAAIARDLDGVATVVIETDPIVAYGWNEPAGQTCSVR